jgi:hypothetical protein
MRFVLVGDVGTGQPEQVEVGRALRAHCEALGDSQLGVGLTLT